MLESQTRCEGVYPVNMLPFPPLDIVHNLDPPVIMDIANGRIPVARYLMVELCYGCRDRVRVKVAGCRGVREADDIVVLEESDRRFGIVHCLFPPRQEIPLVVVVLVVIAGNLLLR